ncbi:MAG: hypothetical protein ABIX01_14980 [Chitinophagaceae bacterium]
MGTESPTINASRIAQRVMEGGHDVPILKIISRYSKSTANCCIASKIVDWAYIYDNSEQFQEPKLLFRVADGKIVKEYDFINDWAVDVLRFIKN